MRNYFLTRFVPRNAWIGTTVESNKQIGRIKLLSDIGIFENAKHFLSCEPLLSDLGTLDLSGIDWVIVGGESGPKARPMKPEWAVSIKKQVESQGSAFFFKQWGTWGSDGIKRNKHANGKMLQGEIIQQMPNKVAHLI
jgi:protein gp37